MSIKKLKNYNLIMAERETEEIKKTEEKNLITADRELIS